MTLHALGQAGQEDDGRGPHSKRTGRGLGVPHLGEPLAQPLRPVGQGVTGGSGALLRFAG